MWPAQVPLWSDGSENISAPVELICGGECGGRAILVSGEGVGAVGGQADGGSNRAIAWTSPPREDCRCGSSIPMGSSHVEPGTDQNQKMLKLVRDSHVLGRAQRAFEDVKLLMDAMAVEGERTDRRLDVAETLVRDIEEHEHRETVRAERRAQNQDQERSASPDLKRKKEM